MRSIRGTSILALCCAISSGINIGVSAFVVPSTTAKISSFSTSSVLNMQSDDLAEEENVASVVRESRRSMLGRAAGGLVAMVLPLVSLPPQGIAASSPSKV